MKNQCESCLLPFEKDPGARESDKYCSYCFKDGKLCYEGDLKGFKEVCFKGMREKGINWPMAKLYTFLIGFAPRWRK